MKEPPPTGTLTLKRAKPLPKERDVALETLSKKIQTDDNGISPPVFCTNNIGAIVALSSFHISERTDIENFFSPLPQFECSILDHYR